MEHVSSLVEVQDDPPFWTKTACIQLGYGLWVNMTVIGIGLTYGWPAVTIPQLLQEDSMNITFEDQAWIASVLTLSAAIGCIISGYLIDKYGRKFLLIFCELPIGAGWIYTACASTPLHIIVGRIIIGIGIGFAYGAPRAYITEITLPNMRGVIGAFPNIGVAVGIMIQAALGSYLKWNSLCIICAVYTLSLFGMYFFLPETPYYILMKSNTDDAKIALKKFRSESFNVDQEMDELKDYKETNDIRRLNCKQEIKELFKTSSCKPLGIGIAYILLAQGSGVNVITMWGVEMLQNSHSSVDAHVGNFILASTRVVFGIITSMLLYKVGRKFLALLSAIGVGLVCLGLAAYLSFYSKPATYPLIFFIAYMAFATLGYYTLPILILFELLPLQVRGMLSGVALGLINVFMFSMNQCYPHMRDSLGFNITIGIFGIISILGALLLYFILPETKNLTLQEIEEYFNDTRPTLVSSRQYIKTQSKSSSILELTMSSSYENKKKRNMRKLQKKVEFDKNTETDEDYDKLKSLFDDKQNKRGVIFKDTSETELKEPRTSRKKK